MNAEVSAALITGIATVIGALIGGLATIATTRSAAFWIYRRRSVRGIWTGTAEELQAVASDASDLAKYSVTAEIRQFRSRVTGSINARSDTGASFCDKFEGRLTTEQDMCLTFWAVDENVHHFGVVVFRIHPNGRAMTGYVLSTETSTLGGRVFIMRADMDLTS
jgi:hypothetical protein